MKKSKGEKLAACLLVATLTRDEGDIFLVGDNTNKWGGSGICCKPKVS